MIRKFYGYCAFGLAFAFMANIVVAEDSYSPYVGQNYPNNVYFGDTHLHTNMSYDANAVGNKRLTPDHAYRFAKGETITATNGMKVKLPHPLDFLVVADHAENLGVMAHLEAGDEGVLKTETGKKWLNIMRGHPINVPELFKAKSGAEIDKALTTIYTGPYKAIWADMSRYVGDEGFRASVWREVIMNAEKHNVPGSFSAFSGFEWTSAGQDGGNLHRVVVFKDGPGRTGQVLPYSRIDSANPQDLWNYLAHYNQKTGGDALAIPHNGNLSNGEMFSLRDWKGGVIGKKYAETRSRWEPLVEVTQTKGDGETHPILSSQDEFADYETWNGWAGPTYEGVRTEGWQERKASEYARSALKLGLQEHGRLGVNPFKFGMIGSTDTHTSLAAVGENNYLGRSSVREPNRHRLALNPEENAAGYAAVWAEENTRESLFAAMKRRETYATTGPRMTVRFFGGWAYDKDDAHRPDLAKLGYAGGVPMGGDLTTAPKGKAPSFLIRAVKDADGANLDRVQVIKGWRSTDGKLHEKIYNVSLSDGRKDKGRKTKAVGSTVNVKEASYTNTIGEAELATVWTDPDFNADELAFYYVRVLEIPTPRWPAYDAKYFGIKDMSAEVEMVTQERAYTSPIWYTP